jgi:FAD binding domain
MSWPHPGDIDHGEHVDAVADGDIHVTGKIDGGSYVVLTSNHGSIVIDGKVDGGSHVSLSAAGDIKIGVIGSGEDKKIDGHSHVTARAGGSISLGSRISGGDPTFDSVFGARTTVDFRACGGITIGGMIHGGAHVRLAATNSGSTIVVSGAISDSATQVLYFPSGSLVPAGGASGAAVSVVEWVPPDPRCDGGPSVVGHWWNNWPWTYGYVTAGRTYPRSLGEISAAIRSVGPGQTIKAVGGGWSFSDASLPFATQAEVDHVSILKFGNSGTEDLSRLLQGLRTSASPMDLVPEVVAAEALAASRYDQLSMKWMTTSGGDLHGADNVRIIDTRSLASTLQDRLPSILNADALLRVQRGAHYFHVEAGITMADLDQLLDHQNPRLAIQASGGSPGATLAGTLSTATHGGEFRWPLLVDQVRAIHLVGPGGQEWWIEGTGAKSIANPDALHAVYPNIDRAHFIGGAWAGITGLTAQDVLNAVIVSMGTMGVIYSVVLEVVPQFGIQQVVTKIPSWHALLGLAGTSELALASDDPRANGLVLNALLDGAVTGTGIGRYDNVYADLAINPFDRTCWITNRRLTPLPVDSNSPAAGIKDYFDALNASLGGSHATDTVFDSALAGRIFDFLGWATDVPANLVDLNNDANQAMALLGFIMRYPNALAAAVAAVSVQAVSNTVNIPAHPDRGQQFLSDLLTGILDALQGTTAGNSDRTDIAYKVGAIGWPDGGVPGRGLEIALAPATAFSFLQKVLFNDLLPNQMVGKNRPLVGYISIRVCPPTSTLMGMQQYSPNSVMMEIVGYRSPEANLLMDAIQAKVIELNRSGLQAMLHWGLENDQLLAADLVNMPVHLPIRPGSATRLDAFKAVRRYLMGGHAPCFDNNFVRRLGL